MWLNIAKTIVFRPSAIHCPLKEMSQYIESAKSVYKRNRGTGRALEPIS